MSSITTQIHSLAAEVKARFYQTMVRLHIQLTRINKRNVIKKQNAIIILKHWIGINRKALYFYLCFATNDSIRVLLCVVLFLISFFVQSLGTSFIIIICNQRRSIHVNPNVVTFSFLFPKF